MNSANISIAMAYHHRPKQLQFTLKRLQDFAFEGEIVICDDFSREDYCESQVFKDFPNLDIKCVKPTEKRVGPSHAFNCALKMCTKDIIIIQNPECCWVGNIAEFCISHLKKGEYIAFGCIWVDRETSKTISTTDNLESITGRWINHTTVNPTAACYGMHFCAAVHREDLEEKLGGGFDEMFSYGVWYDDHEFLFRVRKELAFRIEDTPYVLHQYHDKIWENHLPKPRPELIAQNTALLAEMKRTYGTPEYKGQLPKCQKLDLP